MRDIEKSAPRVTLVPIERVSARFEQFRKLPATTPDHSAPEGRDSTSASSKAVGELRWVISSREGPSHF